MSYEIQDLTGGPSLEPFLALREEVYRLDRWYLASQKAECAGLQRPEYRESQCLLLATRRGRPVARVVARRAPNGLGCLGFFEAHDEPAAVTALFERAIEWLQDRGATQIVGPMEGDTWHPYRLSLGPFDEAPFLLEPHNPSYYPRLWQHAGFEPREDYVSHRVEEPATLFERLKPRLAAAILAGFRFESLDLTRFRSELGRLYRLSIRSFEEGAFYRPISEHRFVELYAGIKPLVDPRLIHFAVDASGEDAGFLFAFPDRRDALAAMAGRTDLFARLHGWLAMRRRASAVNLKSLAVLPEHRRAHLGSALVALTYQNLIRLGYRNANHCLIRTDNPSARYEAGLGRTLRHYRLFQHGGLR